MGQVVSMSEDVSDELLVANMLIVNIAKGHINSEKMFDLLSQKMESMGVSKLVYRDYVALINDGELQVSLRPCP